jgi:hypothetical protein
MTMLLAAAIQYECVKWVWVGDAFSRQVICVKWVKKDDPIRT